MSTPQRRVWLAMLFWVLLGAFVAADWVRTAAQHNPFDEPPILAVGSGARPAGAHCATVPGK